MPPMSMINHHNLTHPSRAGASICIYCSPGTYSNAAETQNLVLTQTGEFNNGGCAGVYVRDPLNRKLNGFPVWINSEGNRFIGWETSTFSMSCYALDQLGGVIAAQGSFPSYNGNLNSPDVTCCWPQYAVTWTQPGQKWSKYTMDLAGDCFDIFVCIGQPSPPAICVHLGRSRRIQVSELTSGTKQ